MHRLLFTLSAIFLSFIQPEKGKITVTIEGITRDTGILVIGLFDNPADFNVTPVMSIIETVEGQSSKTVVFREVPYKKYAISIYHDLNNNNQLEKNIAGKPAEPYGFSNNPQILFGPSYEKSEFELNQAEIKMNIILR